MNTAIPRGRARRPDRPGDRRTPEPDIRPERFDSVEARVDERGYPWLLSRLRRTHRIAGHADHTVLLAEQVQRLGGFLGQTDDAGGVYGHGNL